MPSSNAAARRIVLRRLLGGSAANTQNQLAVLLAEEGFPVTQATVSRDLSAIGAVKFMDASGAVFYALPDHPIPSPHPSSRALRGHLQAFVTGIDSSLNLTVIHTQPSTAPTIASALDAAHLDGVLGTVAGDDTVIIVNRDPDGGAVFARTLGDILKG